MNILLNKENHPEVVGKKLTSWNQGENLNVSDMPKIWCHNSPKDMDFKAKVREARYDVLGLHNAGSCIWDLHMLPIYEPSECCTSKKCVLEKKSPHWHKGTR